MVHPGGRHRVEGDTLTSPMVKDSTEERGPIAPTDSPVPATEASQGDPLLAKKIKQTIATQIAPPRMNQIISREALSDGESCDHKGN